MLQKAKAGTFYELVFGGCTLKASSNGRKHIPQENFSALAETSDLVYCP